MRSATAVLLALVTGSTWSFTTGCQGVPSPPKAKAPPRVASGDAIGLTFLASGAQRLELVDPQGRRMLRDVQTGEDMIEVPGASIEGLSSKHDVGGTETESFSGFGLDIPSR